MTSGIGPLLFGMSVFIGGGAAVAGKIPAPDGEQLAAGRAVYLGYCASCHGENGEGQENWQRRDENGELPAPPHDASGHSWRHSDDMLYRMISRGWRDPFNRTERLTMPAFGAMLSEQEIRDVIAYLKTLWTDEQRVYQDKASGAQ